MDKKEFIFPGTILGIVLIIAIGLIITQSPEAPVLRTDGLATSTSPVSEPSTTPTSSQSETYSEGTGPKPTSTGVTHYYPYGSTTLSLNQVAGFKNAVSIRPVAILTDSRCPVDVRCIQAGTVSLSLRVSGMGTSETRTIDLGKSMTIFGTNISFESVDPERRMSGAPELGAYRFTFTVKSAI